MQPSVSGSHSKIFSSNMKPSLSSLQSEEENAQVVEDEQNNSTVHINADCDWDDWDETDSEEENSDDAILEACANFIDTIRNILASKFFFYLISTKKHFH